MDALPEINNKGEIILSAMLILLLLALGIVFIFIAYQRRLLKQQMEHQQKEKNYQLQLLRASFLSQEKERNRIGKDLHDEIGALLTTAKLYFRHIDRNGEASKFEGIKEKGLNILDETMTSVRHIAHNLRPVVLERLGLESALNNMIEHLHNSGEIIIHLQYDFEEKMDKEYQLNWFRMIQELVNNTLKHADANTINMRLFSKNNRLHLHYSDNGKGLSEGSNAPEGLGIQNLKSRLNLMQGEFYLPDTKGKGFEIKLSSPWKP